MRHTDLLLVAVLVWNRFPEQHKCKEVVRRLQCLVNLRVADVAGAKVDSIDLDFCQLLLQAFCDCFGKFKTKESFAPRLFEACLLE